MCIVQDKLIPVLEWLDVTEKKVKDMELIPTDEEKIQQRIREHDVSFPVVLNRPINHLTNVISENSKCSGYCICGL